MYGYCQCRVIKRTRCRSMERSACFDKREFRHSVRRSFDPRRLLLFYLFLFRSVIVVRCRSKRGTPSAFVSDGYHILSGPFLSRAFVTNFYPNVVRSCYRCLNLYGEKNIIFYGYLNFSIFDRIFYVSSSGKPQISTGNCSASFRLL